MQLLKGKVSVYIIYAKYSHTGNAYLELLRQLGGQLVAGELFPGNLIVLDKLLAVISTALESILV